MAWKSTQEKGEKPKALHTEMPIANIRLTSVAIYPYACGYVEILS